MVGWGGGGGDFEFNIRVINYSQYLPSSPTFTIIKFERRESQFKIIINYRKLIQSSWSCLPKIKKQLQKS